MIHAIVILDTETVRPAIQYKLRRFGRVVFRVLVSLPVSLQDWMYEVLDCFDTIVLNAGNTFRLQEECAFHSCIKKGKKGEFIIVSFFCE